MAKLIITVTVDSSASYRGNRYMPPIEGLESVSGEYVGAVAAGASIMHHYGIHYSRTQFGRPVACG